MNKIVINDIEYKYKYSIRALFIFEKIAGKIFSLNGLMDFYIFYYSMILANNPDAVLSFDEFIDACDENPEISIEFSSYLDAYFKQQEQFNSSKEDNSKKK